MKLKFTTLALVLFTLLIITSCSKQQYNVEVYTFSGENDNIVISNGLIIVTDELEKFIGGELTFKGEALSEVKESQTKFYFYKDGIENVILNNSERNEGLKKDSSISTDVGAISSQDLFYGDDLELIKKSLNLSLSGSFMDDKTFEYNLVLDIKKAF